jgi:hypothetical protein
VKGDIARALFYMAIRYTGDTSSEPSLYLTDAAGITSTTNFMGRLSTLLRWTQADLVDAAEMLRNERVYSYQTNRNPWIAAAFIPALNIACDSSTIRRSIHALRLFPRSIWRSIALRSGCLSVTPSPSITARDPNDLDVGADGPARLCAVAAFLGKSAKKDKRSGRPREKLSPRGKVGRTKAEPKQSLLAA